MSILLILSEKHARKIAWLKSPVRHRTLAPFGGITRIRFKGSSNWTSQPSRLPRYIESRIRPELVKSTDRNCGASVSNALQITCTSELTRSNRLDRQPQLTARSAFPVSRSCGKWPSIFHSPVSTRFRHYKHQTYPYRRKCLPASPGRSRRRHLFHRRTCHSQ